MYEICYFIDSYFLNLKLAKEAWQRSFCMVVLKEEVGNGMFGTYEISQQHIIILEKQQEVKVFG